MVIPKYPQKQYALFAIAVLLIIILPSIAFGAGAKGHAGSSARDGSIVTPRPTSRKAVVLVVNYATWQELRASALPNMAGFLQNAAVGLMNTKGLQNNDSASVWVTLGAGHGASAGVNEMPIAAAGETVGKIIDANRAAFTQAMPGLLGATLEQGKIDRTLTRIDAPRDLSPCLVMDAKGNLPHYYELESKGNPVIVNEVSRIIAESAGLVVISLSLPQSSPAEFYPKAGAQSPERQETLRKADKLMGQIRQLLGPDSLLMLLSPSCPTFANPHARALTPIAIEGPGFAKGILASPSTRRLGLAANVDFAPTLLNFFNLPIPIAMNGRALQTVPSPAPLKIIDVFDDQTATTYRLRDEASPPYAVIAGGILVIVLLILVFIPKFAVRNRVILRELLLLTAASSLAIFLVSAFPLHQAISLLLPTVAVAAIIAMGASVAGGFPRALGLICLLTALVIGVDMLLGAPIMFRSIFGSDPIISGRFYGLGNHEGGWFISAVMLTGGALLDWEGKHLGRAFRIVIWVFMALAMLSLGASFGGANFGQGLSGAITALTFWILLAPAGRKKRRVAAGIILFLLAVAFFIVIDQLQPQSKQSHMVLLMNLMHAEGPVALLDVIKRKFAMAWHFSTFNPALLLSIPVFFAMIIVPLRPPGKWRSTVTRQRTFAVSLAACGIGAFAASVLNDSGTISGIGIVSLAVIGLIYLALEATCESS